MTKCSILIAESDDSVRGTIRQLLIREGYVVLEASDTSTALRLLDESGPHLVIIGSASDRSSEGLRLAREIRRENQTLPIIFIATGSTEALVIAALRAGITDYVKQSALFDDLPRRVESCLAGSRGSSTSQGMTPGATEYPRMVGEGRAVQAMMTYIHKVAATDSNVLITGETGAGKELVAELIHRNGPRRNRPFVRINCAAIPDTLLESELFGYERGAFTGANAAHEGKLQLADGGTILFDEIGDMSACAQAKILRVIETKEAYRLGGTKSLPIDIRVTAATNQDLEPLVAEGKFRKDLFFRLNVVRIHLPPLRDRTPDIPLLVDHYIADLNRRLKRNLTGVSEDALEALVHYDWPGNVRELRNVLEAAAVDVVSGKISRINLPSHVRQRLIGGEPAQATATGSSASSERDRVLSALFLANWNKSKAAAELHWSRMTLYRKIARYHITCGGTGETLQSREKPVTSRAV